MSRRASSFSARRSRRADRGSVLIIVIWTCVGLVALTLYFANSMTSELRAADNRASEVVARQAVAGGTRYAGYILSQFGTNGTVPRPEDYKAEDLPVGDAAFWFIGRDNDQRPTYDPTFGLVDEASKINLNTAPRSMLEALPNITPEVVDAIISWRSRNQTGSTDNNYSRMDPPRTNKGGPFESPDELRLVYGVTLDLLLGEDINRNGALDDNENDGEASAPRDNTDGLLQPGFLEYVTTFTRQPNTRSTGGRRINISTQQTRDQGRLTQFLQQRFGNGRATNMLAAIGQSELRSVAEFMVRTRMTPEEYAQVRRELTVSTASTQTGLININTASETVLACIPGIGTDNASALVAYRLAHPDVTTNMAWITQILNTAAITRAGPYITDESYQFTADVAAVTNTGRGYCREKTIFDMTRGTPRIIYHQELTAYGWALGNQVRQAIRDSKEKGT